MTNDTIYNFLTQDLYVRDETPVVGLNARASQGYEIDADRLTSGEVHGEVSFTGGYIESKGFVSGSAGWRIHSNGDAEFNSGTFRGTFVIGGTLVTVSSFSDLNDAIETVRDAGGGTVSLATDDYTATENILQYSNAFIDGNDSTLNLGGSYEWQIIGSNAYTTGTITATHGSDAITGSGTSWTSDMVGRYILIGDFWYEITAVGGATSITIADNLIGNSVAGDTYVIATTISNVGMENLTLQNTTGSALKGRYIDGAYFSNVKIYTADKGWDIENSANVAIEGWESADCTTWGVLLNNVPFMTITNYFVGQGAGMSLTRVTNTSMQIASVQDITGVGIKFTNCSNLGFINYFVNQTSSHGIEFVSGNADVDVVSGLIDTVGGDCLKLTATSDGINVSMMNAKNHGSGYALNIAAASCDKNIIYPIFDDGTGSGRINNSGTGTIVIGDDTAYGSSWNGDLGTPTKNAVYDKIETITSKIYISTTEVSIVDGGGGTETTLFSTTINGGTLGTNGAFKFRMFFSDIGVHNTDTLTLRIKYGASTLSSPSIAGEFLDQQGTFEGIIIADGATDAQKVLTELFLGEGLEKSGDATVGITKKIDFGSGTGAVDSTANQTFSITAQYANASSLANNDLTAEWLVIEKI